MQVLNFAGGKKRLAPWIISHFGPHQVYVEPYAGSAAVLLAKEKAPLEIYNDINRDLVLFWQTLCSRPEELLNAIDRSLYSSVIDDTETSDTVELARRFFQRTNTTWSHSLTFKTQKRIGECTRTLLHQFEERKAHLHVVAKRIRNVIFECRDAIEIIRKYDGPQTLFYVDPPYFGDRKADLYKHEMMDEASHRRLASVLHACQGNVVLSGYGSELDRDLYSDWTVNWRLALTNGKEQTGECLWIKPAVNGAKVFPSSPPKRTSSIPDAIKRLVYESVKDPNGGNLSPTSKYRLKIIARDNPELHSKVLNKKSSIHAAYKACKNGQKSSASELLKKTLTSVFAKYHRQLSAQEWEEIKEWFTDTCDQNVQSSNNINDNILVSQKFGGWTFLKESKRTKNELYWKCRCQCGTIKWVLVRTLRNGESTSCKSCANRRLKRINMSGQQYGSWTVLDKWKRIRGLIHWLCRCQCGAIKWINGSNLREGKSLSCRSCAIRRARAARKARSAAVEA